MAPRRSRAETPPPAKASPRQRRSSDAAGGATASGSSKAKREFGDHMALEGETSNIATIMLLYYLVIFMLSVCTHLAFGAGLWTVCLYYAVGMAAFYVWHMMAHSKWTGRMNDIHMRHHIFTYPPSAFYGRTRTTIREELGKDCPTLVDLLLPSKTITMQLAHEGPLYLMMALILAAGHFVCGSSLPTLGTVLAMYVAMGLIGNAMHMSFHVKGFELERYAWYRELRALHYLHHLGDMKSNLAMVNLGMDGAMGSLAVSVSNLRQPRAGAKSPSGSGLAELMDAAVLPPGITQELLYAARGSVGLFAATLGFDLPLDIARGHRKMDRPAYERGVTTVLLRIIVVALCANAWYAALRATAGSTPELLHGGGATGAVFDYGQDWMARHVAPALFSDPAVAAAACRLSNAITDISVAILVLTSIFGSTFRPFLAVMIANIVRHAIRVLGPVPSVASGASKWPTPEGWFLMARSDPTAFFSIRVCLSVITLTEILRLIAPDSNNAVDALRRVYVRGTALRAVFAVLGYMNVAFQVVLPLCMRSSFTSDVIIAFVVGRYCTLFASMYCSSFLDAFMP